MLYPKPSHDATVADNAPTGSTIEDYDYFHLITYLRLLDANAEGAEWREVVRIVLRIDPNKEPRRAWHAYETHLARARWTTEHGAIASCCEADPAHPPDRRKRAGVSPVSRRKFTVRWLWLANPTTVAISAMESRGSRSSSRARSTRFSIT